MKEIYFAGGCFWGTEHFFKQVNGVVATEVGYANGLIENPTYEQVCTGITGFSEVVKVIYDETIFNLSFLIELYFKTIDPTTLNQQGNDFGTQYRTGIYFVNDIDRELILLKLEELKKQHSVVVVECLPLTNYYNAEIYHQDYLDKNPTGYCHIDISLFQFAKQVNR